MTRFLSRTLADLEARSVNQETERLFAYHHATKHSYHSVRATRHFLDWRNQPNPFRIYDGVPVIALQPRLDFPQVGTFATIAALAEAGTGGKGDGRGKGSKAGTLRRRSRRSRPAPRRAGTVSPHAVPFRKPSPNSCSKRAGDRKGGQILLKGAEVVAPNLLNQGAEFLTVPVRLQQENKLELSFLVEIGTRRIPRVKHSRLSILVEMSPDKCPSRFRKNKRARRQRSDA